MIFFTVTLTDRARFISEIDASLLGDHVSGIDECFKVLKLSQGGAGISETTRGQKFPFNSGPPGRPIFREKLIRIQAPKTSRSNYGKQGCPLASCLVLLDRNKYHACQ